MEFMVLNRGQVTVVNPKTEHIIISICEPHKEYANVNENDLCQGVLRLKYTDEDDIERARKIGQEHLLMTDEQAHDVVEFVKKYADNVNLIICQCDGGVCRSSGTAAAISLILDGTDKWVFDNNAYIPNMFVRRKIIEAHFGKYEDS